jgi:hypothetical protein
MTSRGAPPIAAALVPAAWRGGYLAPEEEMGNGKTDWWDLSAKPVSTAFSRQRLAAHFRRFNAPGGSPQRPSFTAKGAMPRL